MMKVVCIVDKVGTALDRLAKGVAKYHDNINYVVCDFHPKRPDQAQIERLKRELADADIIDAQYFRSIEKIREMFPEVKKIKTILTANNPYSIEESDWNTYDMNVGNNEYITKRLKEITQRPVEYIPITVDTDFWTFNPDWKFNAKVNSNNGYEFKNETLPPAVLMVANRIESKKGILPVAIACAELKVKFILVGAISDMNYMQSIMATGGDVEFHEQISDEELRNLYYRSTVHVCNSVDNFESGTMPVLEAMLCGVPVLARSVGHVPDLYNGENMVLLEGVPEDVQGIQDKLHDLISDKKKLSELREKAWQTAKSRSFERRAYMYQKLYREVQYPDQTPVSVVVPICGNPEVVRKCLNAIAEQTYKNIEVIISDDGGNENYYEDFGKYVDFPVRYMSTAADYPAQEYGLARARNEATIEATGDVIVYCDQRMIMEPTAIEEFLKRLAPSIWLYGNKGGKKEFVENFSCVYRNEIIQAGLFNERITAYGGMSQETRARWRMQGRRTEYTESAKAIPTGKSSNRNRKRAEIIKMKNRLFKMDLA